MIGKKIYEEVEKMDHKLFEAFLIGLFDACLIVGVSTPVLLYLIRLGVI